MNSTTGNSLPFHQLLFINIQNQFAFGYFLNHPSSLNRITPKAASLNIPPLIFETPSTRLTNTTGTSFILKPHL